MEGTISTEDLKPMLDRQGSGKVVENLAPERYRDTPDSVFFWNVE